MAIGSPPPRSSYLSHEKNFVESTGPSVHRLAQFVLGHGRATVDLLFPGPLVQLVPGRILLHGRLQRFGVELGQAVGRLLAQLGEQLVLLFLYVVRKSGRQRVERITERTVVLPMMPPFLTRARMTSRKVRMPTSLP